MTFPIYSMKTSRKVNVVETRVVFVTEKCRIILLATVEKCAKTWSKLNIEENGSERAFYALA